MRGGSLWRYHTPAMCGRGLKEDVISEVGPIIIESTQSYVQIDLRLKPPPLHLDFLMEMMLPLITQQRNMSTKSIICLILSLKTSPWP